MKFFRDSQYVRKRCRAHLFNRFDTGRPFFFRHVQAWHKTTEWYVELSERTLSFWKPEAAGFEEKVPEILNTLMKQTNTLFYRGF
jgi:hypothetical protein